MSGLPTIIAVLALGLTAGILSGMFGIGGGLVIVPALIVLFNLHTKTAIGTSLFALMWPVGLLGVIEYWRRGELELDKGLWIAVGLFIGAYFGAKITGSISPSSMKRVYGIFLLVMGTYFLYTSRNAPRGEVKPPAAEAVQDR